MNVLEKLRYATETYTISDLISIVRRKYREITEPDMSLQYRLYITARGGNQQLWYENMKVKEVRSFETKEEALEYLNDNQNKLKKKEGDIYNMGNSYLEYYRVTEWCPKCGRETIIYDEKNPDNVVVHDCK